MPESISCNMPVMASDLTIGSPSSQLHRTGFRMVPVLFAAAGDQAVNRFIEFFTATIRNKNTRLAYARAVVHFATWCEARKLTLPQLSPFFVAAYIEELGQTAAKPTVKQHLAAVRMLFDYLVTG